MMEGKVIQRRMICLCTSLFIFIIFFSAETLLGSSFYEKKAINIIVGGNPGGGYDRMARILAKHLPKHIPGKPSFIIQNIPGGPAGGMIATNHLYNIAKPDGLTIGTFNRYMTFLQVTKAEGVKFDLSKFSWIGAAAIEAAVFTIRSDLPYKTIEDLKKVKDQLFVGNTGEIDSGSQFIPVLKAFLGERVKFVTYPSSSDVMLALERKEVDGFGFTYTSAKPLIERGLLRPLLRGIVSGPGIENLSVNVDFIADEKVKTIISLLSSVDRMGRPYAAPPGFPSEAMNILRDAFAKVVKDPEIIEDSKKLRMDLEYVTAEESLKIINNVLNQPKNVVDELNKYIKFSQ